MQADSVATILESLNFVIQPTAFSQIIVDDSVRARLSNEYRDTDVSMILYHFPQYFVIHRAMQSPRTIFFVVEVTKDGEPTPEARATYERFFPMEIVLIMLCKETKEVRAKWLHSSGDYMMLSLFLQQEIGLNLLPRHLAEVKESGWTI